MSENKALEGQLELHWQKVEDIRKFNFDLAERITEFTNTLIENGFKGAYDVDDDVYHNGIGISQSRFQMLKKSPFNYYYHTYKNINKKSERPRHFVDGDFIHRVFLERSTVEELFVSEDPILRLAYEVKPDALNIRATKTYKEKVAEVRLMGKEVIKGGLYEDMYIFEEYIKTEPIIKNVFDNGIPEKAFYSLCPETGLLRKAKIDFLIPSDGGMVSILDLKSTANIDPDKFEWSIFNYNYNTQGAYYTDVVEDCIGKTVKDYIMFTVEKGAPFEFDLGFIDDPSLEAGRTGLKNGYKKFLKELAGYYEKREFPRNKLEIKAYGIPTIKMNDELTGI